MVRRERDGCHGEGVVAMVRGWFYGEGVVAMVRGWLPW